MATANEIHLRRVHPAYLDLTEQAAVLAAREQAEATASLTGLRQRQHALVPAALVAGTVGIAALAGFLLVLVGYQRRLVRQAAASSHQALHDALTGLPNRAWRRWCAGSTPSTACSDRASSSPWPNGPASSTR
jgi:hypothetical protein